MHTNDIRNRINNRLEQEKNTNAYYDMIRSRLEEQQAREVFDFTIKYLQNTVDLLDHVRIAVSAVNCSKTFQPIFRAAYHYWYQDYDYIPDYLGLAGICDDAYLSMSLMQLVANSQLPSGDQVLMSGISTDLQIQNSCMAEIFGLTLATQLDVVADHTYKSIYVQRAMKNIFQTARLGSMFDRTAMMMMRNALQRNRLDEKIGTQLGVMGIFDNDSVLRGALNLNC